jgi:hypothetical protein
MADRVLPKVRLLFPCDEAIQLDDGRWVLTNPWSVVHLPDGISAVEQASMCFYGQLTEGVGEFDLAIQMRYLEADGIWKVIGRGKNSLRMNFRGKEQLRVFEQGFSLTKVPFGRPGLYEFRIVASNFPAQGQATALDGYTGLIRVLDSRDIL